ncbi:peptide ABC transporter permease [Pacificimonas sp. ICDLI1SI03]
MKEQNDSPDRTSVSGRDARGAEIILRTKRRRAVFMAGLVAVVLLGLVLSLAGFA